MSWPNLPPCRLKVTARSRSPARLAANTADSAFLGIYTIGPDPRHFASSRTAIKERKLRLLADGNQGAQDERELVSSGLAQWNL